MCNDFYPLTFSRICSWFTNIKPRCLLVNSLVKQNGLQLNFALLTNEANPLLHCLSRTRILI